jgi:hypothetical protein
MRIKSMTTTYNRLPGASHLMPFAAGPDIHLQFSYTASSMYCKKRVKIDDEVFEYVEVRELDEESKSLLDAMPADDYVAPASHFSGLSGDERTLEALNEAFRQFRLVADERARLRDELNELEVETDARQEVECQLEIVNDDASEVLSDIAQAIKVLNQASGYDPKAGTVDSSEQS